MKYKKRNLRIDFKELNDHDFLVAEKEYNNFIDKILGNIAFIASPFIAIIQIYLAHTGDKLLFKELAINLTFPRLVFILCCISILILKPIKQIKIRGIYPESV
jgi:hypothetical protein